MKNNKPAIILISGKRYAGKDFVCAQLLNYVTEVHQLSSMKIAHSDMVKVRYCEQTGVDLPRLLRDRAFKEVHRNGMIALAQRLQQEDPLILSQLLLEKMTAVTDELDLLFISDFRRKREQIFFEKAVGRQNVITIRINATDQNRTERGWQYDLIKDQRYTECELDDKKDWDLLYDNNGTANDLLTWIETDFLTYLTAARLLKR